MAIVRMTLNDWDEPSPESIARIEALDGRPIDFSDIPEASPEELMEMRRQSLENHKKKMFSLRLGNDTIEWWQRLGSGYTGVMARLLEQAKTHPEWIKQCL
ncbi:hypothetical protein FACS189485_15510 [Spirochaetia bacterium]|nr:hypothetical protein FACS1894106_4880 [Spirochaetia bacterium]GHV06643.1 hypothetical protein FACS189485_15510 [Spirochaetia bacterium]